MPVQLLPMPQSEWGLYYDVSSPAFYPGFTSLLFPDGISDQAKEMLVAGMKREANRYPGRINVFKVVDTDLPDDDPFQKIVGVSLWKIFDKERTDEDMEKEKEESEQDLMEYGIPPGANMAFFEGFANAGAQSKKKHIGGKPHIQLHLLATRPDQGRKGVGALSMKWGCDKADELCLPGYIEGSPMGQGLCRKWGFEDVEVLPFDARKYGFHDELRHMVMIRQAKEDASS
ncbi:hypothetical protein CKM354_000042400 [Cercospora kikuchii]|uniref:N-acetyltransferase domain-containing protein n=1 Tax=Cercospora kikuchii TaxID=84275 RepID=A0A9P3FBL3_9PEZI|nr:uncharacterized protein CKM354_000042400 [Cercospora kikuchii]GIZ36959.1 hypothetical protein CKM354_000042400 [Cercospora kikuchii]